MNPHWEHRLWSDEELEAFVAMHYPDFLTIFRTYPAGVQRADAARYLLLDHFGGVYSDIDTECLASFDAFCSEDRIVVCEEPRQHWEYQVKARGLARMIFNGTLAGPKNHPFWAHLLEDLKRNCSSELILDSTGPFILSGSMGSYPDQSALSINSSHLFCGKEKSGANSPDARTGDYGDKDMSIHHWAGSWYVKEKYPLRDKIESYVRSWIYNAKKGPQFKPTVNREILESPLIAHSGHEEVAILIPVRDAEPHLNQCLELLSQLDWPKSKLHVTFCEGDSKDNTLQLLQFAAAANKPGFGSFRVIEKSVGTVFDKDRRWHELAQFQRRSGLAKVRNELIGAAIPATADWVLWIDSDVNFYPPGVLHSLLAAKEKIVVPHCLRDNGSGKTFDLNTFATVFDWRDTAYFKRVIGGLYQPPQNSYRRLHLQDVRYLSRISLNGVGGTMLLVHADLHRAGLRFPDLPYKDLIETEAFGQLAHDCGVAPIGLPNLLITHPAS